MNSFALFNHKIVSITLFLLVIITSLDAQNREPQNVYRVTVISQYVLENGQRTKNYFAVGQLIYDSLGRLHTEIDYNSKTHYPDNYRWHYFNGLTKYKTDFFLAEKLVKIEEYKFNEKGDLLEITVNNVTPTDTSLFVRVEYSYNSNGKIQKATGFDSRGKNGYNSLYKYDTNGTEIERKVKVKKVNPPDSILFLSRTPFYDSTGRISAETLIVEKLSKGRTTSKYSYKYDTFGNIIQIIEESENGNQLFRNEFIYRKDNRIQQLKKYDANNSLIDFFAWSYEIYKTNDRRQRVLE